MDATEWRSKRIQKIEGLRGTYLVEIPDVLTLLEDWKNFGVDFKDKNLGEEVVRIEVIKKMLMKYVKEPKITVEPTESTIGIDELIKDQADVSIIYKAIISEFICNPDRIEAFFRDLSSSTVEGNSTSISSVAKRYSESTVESNRKDSVQF
jgi:hypothetical protein